MENVCICCGSNLMFSFSSVVTEFLHLKRSDGCCVLQTHGEACFLFLTTLVCFVYNSYFRLLPSTPLILLSLEYSSFHHVHDFRIKTQGSCTIVNLMMFPLGVSLAFLVHAFIIEGIAFDPLLNLNTARYDVPITISWYDQKGRVSVYIEDTKYFTSGETHITNKQYMCR